MFESFSTIFLPENQKQLIFNQDFLLCYNQRKNLKSKEWIDLKGKEVRIGTGLLVGDMKKMVHFYRNLLGFQTQWTNGDFAEFETASGDLALFMYSREAFVQAIDENYIPPKGINQTFELALWLPCFADVDVEYERLSKLGLSFPTGAPMTFSFGIRNFYVTDPEGNLLEIGSTNEQ